MSYEAVIEEVKTVPEEYLFMVAEYINSIKSKLQENPVMEIFGKISHEEAEEIRKNRVNFGEI